MKKLFKLFTCALAAAVVSVTAAVSAAAYSYGIDDQAGLYSAEELSQLEARQEEVADYTGWNIAIVTTNTGFGENNLSDAIDYAENYYEDAFGSLNETGILYLIDLDWRHIVLCGDVDTVYFNNARKNTMHDACEARYKDYDDVGNLETFYNYLVKYYDAGPYENDPDYDPDNSYYANTVDYNDSSFHLGSAAICALICAIITVVAVVNSYKFHHAPSANTYLDKSKVNFYRRSDRFVREFTTRTKIESSSGGSGGRSSGGGHRTGGSSRGGRR